MGGAAGVIHQLLGGGQPVQPDLKLLSLGKETRREFTTANLQEGHTMSEGKCLKHQPQPKLRTYHCFCFHRNLTSVGGQSFGGPTALRSVMRKLPLGWPWGAPVQDRVSRATLSPPYPPESSPGDRVPPGRQQRHLEAGSASTVVL